MAPAGSLGGAAGADELVLGPTEPVQLGLMLRTQLTLPGGDPGLRVRGGVGAGAGAGGGGGGGGGRSPGVRLHLLHLQGGENGLLVQGHLLISRGGRTGQVAGCELLGHVGSSLILKATGAPVEQVAPALEYRWNR